MKAKAKEMLAFSRQAVFDNPESFRPSEPNFAAVRDGLRQSPITIMLGGNNLAVGVYLTSQHARLRFIADDERQRGVGRILFRAINFDGRMIRGRAKLLTRL